MVLLKELNNKPIKNITFQFNDINEIIKLKDLTSKDGETEVTIIFSEDKKIHTFRLKNKRMINYELINALNIRENVIIN